MRGIVRFLVRHWLWFYYTQCALSLITETEMNLPIFSQSLERIQEIPDVKANIEMAQQILGWSPKWTFRDGIRHIIKGACV